MTHEQALWEGELERAISDLETAKKYDDFGSIVWNEERIRYSKMKIREYEEYEKHKRGA
ncbi:hypothetical protein [Paenibacillus macerans]|uniref:hypothetical protein n=1 Tax=Paenibacillus macerans TaxID=44252 RepID=UPI002040ED51|nr:hypothetical protein [Paenibacillus macerans]MCM3703823.1 hypothetical protein [Paenibacillus macerans]